MDGSTECACGARPRKRLRAPALSEVEKNFFFCGGDYEHTFEYGQQCVPEWKDMSEENVLLERVAAGHKPVASIVVGSTNDMKQDRHVERKRELLNQVRDRGLVAEATTNAWGVEVLYVARNGESTLQDLLEQRRGQPHHERVALRRSLKTKRVRDYLSGFDAYLTGHGKSRPSDKVSVLVSALLLGYPLDLAADEEGVA